MAWEACFLFLLKKKKNYFHSLKILWDLTQDNYGPNKIGWVTLPQKVNGKKIR